ncbi:MAG: aminoacetone oxidase family FAD-binding enzyme [Lachnospiraceae bacterium]|nr:aminoacetone oxidase family FAD-binding enzyme [Lachnospiraceae bacterium]
MKYDVCVIGGGASGLTSAIKAAERGLSVCVIDKRDVPGKKILSTGNGRCNISNVDQDVRHYHSEDQAALKEILSKVSFDEVIEFFEELGIKCRSREGYLYPLSNQAQSVEKALWLKAKELGVRFELGEEVISVKERDIFNIRTDKSNYQAENIIIATGTAAGYSDKEKAGESVLNSLNIHVKEFKPALTYIASDARICKYWAGVRAAGKLELLIDGERAGREYGELMLTENGISGIAAFQLSHLVSKNTNTGKKLTLKMDFVPDLSREDLKSFIKRMAKETKRGCEGLYGILYNKLADSLFIEFVKNEPSMAGRIAHRVRLTDLSEEQIDKLVYLLKHFTVKVSGTGDASSSQVLMGGVPLSDIDRRTMMLKKHIGIYLTGEVLDVNGDCGGYNLTWAWITGMIAGGSVGGRNDKNNRA